jgi:myo-inositol-1(or 4)-monophosphatase
MSSQQQHSGRSEDIQRIRQALETAAAVIDEVWTQDLKVDRKGNDDPVTVVDLAVDKALRQALPRAGEGWLSEETADDAVRLDKPRVWIVDPLDGTKEFVQGLPEWCVSVGLVENGQAVAGGILNPASGELFIGSLETGVLLNEQTVRVSDAQGLEGATVLASRSELKRGQWDRFKDGPVRVGPMGSVAYKLALVAAGKADATWSLAPKHEWDVAAGVALVRSAGGEVLTLDGAAPRFNQRKPWLPGLLASNRRLLEAARELLVDED